MGINLIKKKKEEEEKGKNSSRTQEYFFHCAEQSEVWGNIKQTVSKGQWYPHTKSLYQP